MRVEVIVFNTNESCRLQNYNVYYIRQCTIYVQVIYRTNLKLRLW